MIVLLDIERQVLTLYKKDGAVDIPFTHAGEIDEYMEGKNVLYITNAIEVNSADILGMIRGMGVAVQEDAPDTGIKYLRSTSEGTIYIDDTLKFEGKFDCKVIDKQLAQAIKRNPVLQDLIRNNKIEIIGEVRKRKMLGEFKKSQIGQMEKQKLIDAKLDGIILKTKVEDWDGTIGATDRDNAVVIDVSGGGRVGAGGGIGPTFNTMSELLDNIDGLE